MTKQQVDNNLLPSYQVKVTEDSGSLVQHMITENDLIPASFDAIELLYTGDDVTTAIYKKAGVAIATLTMTWNTGKLTGVSRA
jgi:hypothetical protein